MKTLIYLSLLLFALFSCEKDTSVIVPIQSETPTIIGRWQLTKTFISNGGPTDPVKVTNGYILELSNANTFKTTESKDCSSGTFSEDKSIITYAFTCTNASNIPNKFKIMSNTTTELVLSDLLCDEGCVYTYRRVK
ncbi:MAG TPA: hypothetical protein PLD18_04445 [Flavobacterium sp.]|mgnify:CR=1 FL=1|nr:hypothetical protein [Flavobacterium sp.]